MKENFKKLTISATIHLSVSFLSISHNFVIKDVGRNENLLITGRKQPSKYVL